MRKRERGITLIALVVTIVVLLILAAVSISMLGGENGIITQAQNAKLETRGGEVEERVNLWKSEKISSKYTNATVKTEDELLEEMKTEKILFEEEIDRENKLITIGSKKISYAIENDIAQIPDINNLYTLKPRKVKEEDMYYLKYDLIHFDMANVQNILPQIMAYVIEKNNITGTDEEKQNAVMGLFTMKSMNEVINKNFQTIEEYEEYMNSLTKEEQMSLVMKVAIPATLGRNIFISRR